MNSKQKENSIFDQGFEGRNKHSNVSVQAEEILATLDINVAVPDDLVERVIREKNKITLKPSNHTDLSKYIQIAIVFVAAVLIGIFMGKNANGLLLQSKQNQEKRALIELRNQHHLSDNNSFGKF